MLHILSETLLPFAMFVLMFSIGLSLIVDDFRRVISTPVAILSASALQLIVLPLISLILVKLFELPALIAVGFVVIAACPGGMLSNMFVYIGRANTALSITLTATATCTTLLTLPLWIGITVAWIGAESNAIQIPIYETTLELLGLTVAPVLAGVAARHYIRKMAQLEKPLSAFSTVLIITLIAIDAASKPPLPSESVWSILPAALTLVLISATLGFISQKLFRQPTDVAIAVAIELCVKNLLLGLVIVERTFTEFTPSVPILMYSALMVPTAIILIVLNRYLTSDSNTHDSPENYMPDNAASGPFK